jgi:hypothetical protein
MPPSTWKFLLSSGLLCLSVLAMAQEVRKAERDSPRSVRLPTGLRIGTDLIALGKNYFNSPLAGWEVNADLDLGRYYLAFDYGHWDRTDSVKNGLYRNDGVYWRVGTDINFLLKDPDKNMFFLGFRFAQSTFNEVLEYKVNTVEFGQVAKEAANFGVIARWGELTTGLRVKVWKVIWLGYTARLKIFPYIKNQQQLEVYEIPGYGLAAKNFYWGFNYQVFIRLPFKGEKHGLTGLTQK